MEGTDDRYEYANRPRRNILEVMQVSYIKPPVLKPSANGSTSFSRPSEAWKKKCIHRQKALIQAALCN